MKDFAEIDTHQERKFQSWLRAMGINPDEWFDNRECTKEAAPDCLQDLDLDRL